MPNPISKTMNSLAGEFSGTKRKRKKETVYLRNIIVMSFLCLSFFFSFLLFLLSSRRESTLCPSNKPGPPPCVTPGVSICFSVFCMFVFVLFCIISSCLSSLFYSLFHPRLDQFYFTYVFLFVSFLFYQYDKNWWIRSRVSKFSPNEMFEFIIK